MHDKIQYGDKCSMPSSIGKTILSKSYDVPWLFEILPVGSTSTLSDKSRPQSFLDQFPLPPTAPLSKAYISPLDFRSPENYVFIPQWVMNCLGLKPWDLVDIRFLRMKLASLVTLQPLSLAWETLQKNDPTLDLQALLEKELNKYSTLTQGSIISIRVKGKANNKHSSSISIQDTFKTQSKTMTKRISDPNDLHLPNEEEETEEENEEERKLSNQIEIPFYVKELIAEGGGGVAVRGVRIQDADVKTEIDLSLIEKLKKKKTQVI